MNQHNSPQKLFYVFFCLCESNILKKLAGKCDVAFLNIFIDFFGGWCLSDAVEI
jgi:hypothetical protein